VANHGSERATGVDWVEALAPRLALISVGARYGPAQPVLDRLAGRTILRTDLDRTVRVFSDGEKLWVEAEQYQS
jgi:beta-lactamase superfamily II metal-dependent hydrolase